jgi:proline dehydrogenase
MLRSLLISLSRAEWARQAITRWKFAWKMANRFVAGETLEDAIQTVKELNRKGIVATLDYLGEYVHDPETALHSTKKITDIFEAISATQVRSCVSVKLSQLGLTLSESFCCENLLKIVQKAHDHQNFVRIDMEDSSTVEATFRLFHRIRTEYGFDNVGVVIQAYLYRSEDDVRELLRSGTRIRLCKGAYKESPEVAFPKKSSVDENFDRLAKMMLDKALKFEDLVNAPAGRFPPLPAIATHDEKRIQFARNYANQIGLPNSKVEFQMLHGIRRDLQERLVQEDYPVRVYVPYGTQWYPYFMRRLAERPANVWFLLTNLLRK